MEGFIEVTYLDKWRTEHKVIVHFSQVYFISNYAYWSEKRIKESYEEIKKLIKQATEL